MTGGLNDLRNQRRVFDGLAALHDSHNGRLCLEVPVCRDSLVRRLVLLLSLLQLNLVDFYAHLRVRESWVIGEGIGRVDILPLGVLRQDPVLSTRKRLQGSLQFRIRFRLC